MWIQDCNVSIVSFAPIAGSGTTLLVRALCIGANPSTSNHRTAKCNPTCAEVMHPVHVVLHDIPLVLTMPCPHVLLRRVLVALGS